MESHMRYNCIGEIEEQARAWREMVSQDVIDSVAQIFFKHDATDEFGLSLLHRHQTLPPDHAMVHLRDAFDNDVCAPEKCGPRTIYPSSFHLHEGKFWPYEFSSRPTPAPKEEFMQELAQYVGDRSLGGVIAVSHVDAKGQPWLEKPAHDGEGTEAVRLPYGSLDSACDEHILTEWAICRAAPNAALRALRACVKDNEAGGHWRVPDK